MPDNNYNQRLKIMYLYKILNDETDEEHQLTLAQISDRLAEYGISAKRKALYDDIEALRQYGVDIICEKTKTFGYYVGNREFELPELKLLADAVCSARCLSVKKSSELLKKIESLAGIHNGKLIQRQVYVVDRAKSVNERIYINVDALHRAINEGKKISFRYFDYDINAKPVYRDGDRICSPLALSWDDGKYYLIGIYPKYPDTYTNFRVDRMSDITVLDEPAEKAPSDFSISEYMNTTFSMFSGNTVEALFKFDNSLVNVIVDRFGKNVRMNKYDEQHFTVKLSVRAEATFFGWLFQFGQKAEILSPLSLKKKYAEMLSETLDSIKL